MFGRWKLPLWRRVVGAILVLYLAWGLSGFVQRDLMPSSDGCIDLGCNSSFVGPDGSVPPDFALPIEP